MKLSEIVDVLKLDRELQLEELEIEIKKINTLSDGQKGDLSFLQNSQYLSDLKKTDVSAVLVSKKDSKYVPKGVVALISQNPYIDLALISKYFASPIEIKKSEQIAPKIGEECKIGESVFLGSGVEIGDNVTILHNSYIGDNVKIGTNSIIYPNVTVYKETEIGKNVIIHSGTVIGSDGFGFATTQNGEHIKIYQNGNVVIEDGVEIGANSTVDRAVFNSTFVRKGARIDNLVQIGHNCDIGEGAVLVSQVGIAGSTQLGRNVVMGGQSGTVGHIKIAPFSTITGKAGITKSIKRSGLYWSGYPAVEHKSWLKLQAKITKFFHKG
jgi:UDP-3-O-[3-hydroxymyristoyl] glucosamine N-acyltransferase